VAWEWVAPAAGAIVGLAGLAGGWATARGSRRHEREMAEARYAHERATEDAKWRRDKRAEAYLAILNLSARAGGWLFDWKPESIPDRSARPNGDASRPAWVALAAFGSAEVRAAASRWDSAQHRAYMASFHVVQEDTTTWSEFEDLREVERQARVALADTVSAEIRGTAA